MCKGGRGGIHTLLWRVHCFASCRVQCFSHEQDKLKQTVTVFFPLQTQETPIHYCARAGNADILLEIVKHIGPNKTQVAVNKQAKVSHNTITLNKHAGKC